MGPHYLSQQLQKLNTLNTKYNSIRYFKYQSIPVNTNINTMENSNTPNIWNVGSSNNANTEHWTRSSNLILGAPRDLIESRPPPPTPVPQPPYNGQYPFYYIDTRFVKLTAIQYFGWKSGHYQPVKDEIRPQVLYPPHPVIDPDFWNSWRPLKLSSNEIVHHKRIGTYWIEDSGRVILAFGTGGWVEVDIVRHSTENTDPENEVDTLEEFVPIFNYDEVSLVDAIRVSFDDTIYPLLDPMAGLNIESFLNMLDDDATVTEHGSDFEEEEVFRMDDV